MVLALKCKAFWPSSRCAEREPLGVEPISAMIVVKSPKSITRAAIVIALSAAAANATTSPSEPSN